MTAPTGIYLYLPNSVPTGQQGVQGIQGATGIQGVTGPLGPASVVPYTPGVPSAWSGVVPTSVGNALDRLATKAAPVA